MNNDNNSTVSNAGAPQGVEPKVVTLRPVASDPKAISPEAVRKLQPGESAEPIVTDGALPTSTAPSPAQQASK